MLSNRVVVVLSAFGIGFLSGGAALSQVLPQERTFDVMVSDNDLDRIVRLSDRTQNGLFKTLPDEWALLYDGTLAGGPLLDTPASLVFDAAGRLYVADTGTDAILYLFDYTGDGDALSSQNGEFGTFCDNSNGSGIVFTSILKIAFDSSGSLWGVNSGAGTAPLDFVFRAVDQNGDLDAQDFGEIAIWYDNVSSAVKINTPFGLAIDPSGSGDVYVSDVNPDGIYRLRDGNGDLDFNDAGETVAVFNGPAGGPLLSNANTLRFHPNGDLYYNDATTDQIVRLRDGNADLDYNDPGEATVFADKTGNPFGVPANHFDVEIDENGAVWAVENSAGDFVVRYTDRNADDDAQDPGETVIVYDSALGPGSISAPRAIALVPAPRASSPSATVQLGGTLVLDLACADVDSVSLLVGAVPLGGPTSAPPFGYLGFVPAAIVPLGTMPTGGALSVPLFVPPTLPTPLPVYLGCACGKAPFRTYLSNDVAVTIVP